MDTDILKHPAAIIFRTEVHLNGEGRERKVYMKIGSRVL